MKDIKEILKFLRELPKMIGMFNMPTEKVDVVQSIREIIYEWKGYKDLEEQGKLLKLPCNIGDFVFFINKYELIELHKIVSINVDIDGVYCASSRRFCRIDDFGKTVFLTREEAEAALKEL